MSHMIEIAEGTHRSIMRFILDAIIQYSISLWVRKKGLYLSRNVYNTKCFLTNTKESAIRYGE
jgi:hypothetical protein